MFKKSIETLRLSVPEVRRRTDALDAAGNTTAAIGKGFAIGSAALVSLALYGAFVVRLRVKTGAPRHQLTNSSLYTSYTYICYVIIYFILYIFISCLYVCRILGCILFTSALLR